MLLVNTRTGIMATDRNRMKCDRLCHTEEFYIYWKQKWALLGKVMPDMGNEKGNSVMHVLNIMAWLKS
jgi:hypothetical protein